MSQRNGSAGAQASDFLIDARSARSRPSISRRRPAEIASSVSRRRNDGGAVQRFRPAGFRRLDGRELYHQRIRGARLEGVAIHHMRGNSLEV